MARFDFREFNLSNDFGFSPQIQSPRQAGESAFALPSFAFNRQFGQAGESSFALPFFSFNQQFGQGGEGGFALPGFDGSRDLLPSLDSDDIVPEGSGFNEKLLEEKGSAFHGALNRADLTPNQRTFFETRQDEIFDRFQGQRDTQLRKNIAAGRSEDDPLRFVDFANQFDFGREFQRRPPGQRFGATNLNRQLRFIN